MFYSITGKLSSFDENSVILENQGIGYEILIPHSIRQSLIDAGDVTIFVKQIVREDEIYLVGFKSPEDRRLFETLMTVSGIGPKQGLKILSDMPAGEIRNAIITGDVTSLSRIKGVGPKTAARIVLELKDKIKKLQIQDIPSSGNSQEKKKLEILLAMRVLGYTDSEARRSIDSAFQSSSDIREKDVEDIIKFILSNIGR